MDCSQVTELLSEYVDDVLDASTKTRLDEHLANCPTCSADLTSLRSYLEAMHSLPQMQAPAGFLTNLHERLDQPGWFKRLLGWLFLPMKVKLPFEAAGLVAASLLVVLLYRGIEPQKTQLTPASPASSPQATTALPAQTTAVPSLPAPIPSAPPPSSAGKSLENSLPLAVSRPAPEESKKDEAPPLLPGPAHPSAQAVPAEQSSKTAPAPLLERAEPPRTSRLTPPTQDSDVEKKPATSLSRESLPAKPQAALPGAGPKPFELVLRLPPPAAPELVARDVSREKSSAGASATTAAPREREQALFLKVAPAPLRTTEQEGSAAPVSPAAVLSRIKELLEQAQGSLLSVTPPDDTQLPQLITAQVPARSFDWFVAELERLGQLEKPAAKLKSNGRDDPIRLQIELVPAKEH